MPLGACQYLALIPLLTRGISSLGSILRTTDSTVCQSPFCIDKKKLLFLPWSLGKSEDSWPAITPVWIRLWGIPYHCWSSDILLSIASSIGKPLCLDEITATQGILSYVKILVNLDVATPCPKSISVDLEGDVTVEVEIQYENIPSLECFSAGHLTDKYPFTAKLGLLRRPAPISMQAPSLISSDRDLSKAVEFEVVDVGLMPRSTNAAEDADTRPTIVEASGDQGSVATSAAISEVVPTNSKFANQASPF